MQPTSSGGLRHPDASEFSEHPIKEVPEVSVKPLGLLGLNRGRREGGCLKFREIKVGKEATAPLKGRVFKIPKKSRLVERRQLPLKGAHI